ncbi:Deneddylase [Quillaja saponaria]|uniref:Deneddylase n=1 Tax=Quillaja saponaria TaxID=32244 RepID=A0AAD7M280_QUISA|nr:Deneddylase [Quillaja saponaria]
MAHVQNFSLLSFLLPLKTSSKILSFSPVLHLSNSRSSVLVLSCSTRKAVPFTEQDLLQAVAESTDKILPCVRTYENDLTRLTLVGAVDFEQALTAAAADGGEAATEHINSGMPAMVVETVFPGSSGDHSTVSTRLFLPARKVKEKATKLRRSLSQDMLSSTSSRNILAMTFRQVVLQQLWNFDLVVFRPGTERNMEDLENPREVPASFTLSLSDEHLISMLAEAICTFALQSTERQFINNFSSRNAGNFFHWFQNSKRIGSKGSSVILRKLFEHEILDNAKNLLETYNSKKNSFIAMKGNSKYHWLKPSYYSQLKKIGGSDFSAWTSEYVSTYRLEIDNDRLNGAKFEGWRRSTQNRWEVLLTHSQMIGLADSLDMYYEDPYSLPDKQLSCGVAAKLVKLPNIKRTSSLLKMLSVTLASGIFLVTISALGQLCFPYFRKFEKAPAEHRRASTSEVHGALRQFLDATELEEFCVSVVKKVKDAYGWPGDIKRQDGTGALIGEIPTYLRSMGADDSNSEGISTVSTALENIDSDARTSAQDIASYQVVFSSNGAIIGFQPLSRVAVNHWAANPLAKELYGGRKLSPGLIEPGLKVPHPSEVVVLELLMSIKPGACFALARPFR